MARMSSAPTKAVLGIGAFAVAALMSGCSLPPTNVTVGSADNGKTLNVGLGSTIDVKLSPYAVPTSSNPKVLGVQVLCAAGGTVGGGGGGGPIVGCFVFARAIGVGSATLTAPAATGGGCPASPACAGGPLRPWRITVNVFPNPGAGGGGGTGGGGGLAP